MKEFTSTESAPIKKHDAETDQLIIVEAGETRQLPDHVVEFFCAQGWGTSPGIESGERKAGGVHRLTAANTVSTPK